MTAGQVFVLMRALQLDNAFIWTNRVIVGLTTCVGAGRREVLVKFKLEIQKEKLTPAGFY